MRLGALPIQIPAMSFDYFDMIALAWLIIGLLLGRKRGMTQEVLPTLQWVAIVVFAGLFYKPFAALIHQYTQFDTLWSNIAAYVLIGVGIHLIYLWLKGVLAERLAGSDIFGRAEFYAGMACGVLRFGCILVAFCALMNARIISKAELAQTEKMQAQNFSDIRFPTFGSVQQTVLFQSFTGRAVKDNLAPILIASVAAPAPGRPTMAQQQESMINEVLGSRTKRMP